MRTAKLLAGFVILLALAMVLRPWLPGFRTRAAATATARAGRGNALQAELRQANEVFRAGRYREALARFEQGYRKATAAGEPVWAARFLGNVGACRFALSEYQPALEAFQQASRLAAAGGDPSAAAALDINIASLYSQMGETGAAAEWIEKSLPRISGRDRQDHLPKVHIQLATLRARQGRMREAEELFRSGIAGAERTGDWELYAGGWNRLGEVFLLKGDRAAAEPALLEAYRVRKLHRLRMETSYRSLGRLRFEQGDLAAAGALLDRAVEAVRGGQGSAVAWDVYYRRGRLRLARGRLAEALADFRAALELARIWRFSGPPEDTARVSADVLLDELCGGFAEAAARLYRRNGDAALAREAFEAVEESRAASLRALTAGARRSPRELPPDYWATLSRLQAAEVRAIATGAPADTALIGSLRAELIRLEVRPGSNPEPEIPHLFRRTQRVLRPDEALLSFYLAESESYLWAVDAHGFSLHVLPPARDLTALAREFSREVREGRSSGAGERLFAALFGSLDSRVMKRRRWLLTLDSGLFGVPVAASVVRRRNGVPIYLAALHATQVVPSAAWLVAVREQRTAAPPRGTFLAVADPIYNFADERWQGARGGRWWRDYLPDRLFAASRGDASASAASLPRLAASAREAASCAAVWGGQTVTLSGAGASRQAIRRALSGDPAVAHFATHVLESGGRPRHGLIALSLSPQGQIEVLTPNEIGSWNSGPSLVVLSGCASGAGDVLPGAGLMGLTRAWLAVGTRAVAASYWPTADDTGALFQSFYRHLKQDPSAGAPGALQQAQLEMLSASDWRSAPHYWGAYFVTGSE